jgi:hypothetical protein
MRNGTTNSFCTNTEECPTSLQKIWRQVLGVATYICVAQADHVAVEDVRAGPDGFLNVSGGQQLAPAPYFLNPQPAWRKNK